ncbi:MAG TPA: twin-arginine translocase TatA/TatE family subunit [Steroidobacteraceae bacterium]|nr:twin-arginine translocase TatA/TatE family subunit [Steroidobacteraceae bacterium]
MGIGMRELLVILVVVLLVFGTKKLKTIGSDLGGAVRGFKKAMEEGEAEQRKPSEPANSIEPGKRIEAQTAVASSTAATPAAATEPKKDAVA